MPHFSKIEVENGQLGAYQALPSPQSFTKDAGDRGKSSAPLAWRSGIRPTFTTTKGNDRDKKISNTTRNTLNTPRQNLPTHNSLTPASSTDGRSRNNSTSNTTTTASTASSRSVTPSRKSRKKQNQEQRSKKAAELPSAALTAETWWRQGPMPRHLRADLPYRPIADPRSLQPGCMIWLPSKEMVGESLYCIREGHPCGGEELNDTGFDHPGVILGTFVELGPEGKLFKYCTIAQLRTFKRTSSKVYSAGAGQQFRESIPIRYPEKYQAKGRLGDNVEQLDLLRGNLFNQTYIQLQHIFKVPVSKIMVFHFGSRLATDVKLTNKSFVRLMNLFGYTEELGDDGSLPAFGPSPPESSQMHGYYGSNFPKAGNHEGG